MILRLALSAFLLAAGITAASAHSALDHASPAVGSTVASAPARVTLTFTEPIEGAFSGAVVRNASGQRVDTGARVGPDKTEMQISLKPLQPGTYKVEWHVLSVDTHKTQGSFSFTVGVR
jgi:methionine-rich copper-binding protein CopC